MDSSRWERIEQLFVKAAELPPEGQKGFVESSCGEDAELMEEVLAMLEEDRHLTSPLEKNLRNTVDELLAGNEETLPRSFGPYRLMRILGEGGMGVVWLARREDFDTQVAMKFLLHAGLSPFRSRLFTNEIKTLARLKHQYIARLYDAGTTTSGTPWFVMEYVDGEKLLDYCDRHSLSLQKRLQLFHSVCEAVQYAHSQEVIHRDLKPSNILVAADGTPKLLDFGIAKQIHVAVDSSDRTQPELRILTPEYSAPEWAGSGHVGFATDVYSLGVILFELLVGRRPRPNPTYLSGTGWNGIMPEVFSHAIKTDQKGADGRHHGETYAGSALKDLDALCLRAMHPDVENRYPSVEALLRDLDHFLNGEPLEARPDTLRYKTEKFVRRHLNMVASAFLVLCLFVGLIGYFTYRLAKERNMALEEAESAKRIELFMENLFNGGDPKAGPIKDLKVSTVLDHGVSDARALGSDPDAQAALYRTLGHVYQQLGDYKKAETLLNQAMERSRTAYSIDSVEFGKDQLAQGLLLLDTDRLPQAEQSVRSALAIEQRHLPAKHPAVVDAHIALGSVLTEQGKYTAAESEFKQALLMIPAGDTARLADPLTKLGDAYFYEGKYNLAQPLYQQALDKNVQLHGDRHPADAEILIDLGHIAGYASNYEQSLGYYRRALEIYKGWYGEDNPDTADAMNYVANELYWLKRDDEAVALLKPALEIMMRHYGENHSRVALVAGMLGSVADDMGHHEEARAYFLRAMNVYKAIYGPMHQMVAVELGNLGTADQWLKHYALAEKEFREALRISSETQSPTHINTAIQHIRLGRVLKLEKQYREACQETLAGYKILSGKTDAKSHYLQNARHDLADEYKALHQPDLANKYTAEYTANLSHEHANYAN